MTGGGSDDEDDEEEDVERAGADEERGEGLGILGFGSTASFETSTESAKRGMSQ